MTTTDTALLVLDLLDFRTLTARHPDLAEAIDAEAKRRVQENLERGMQARYAQSSSACYLLSFSSRLISSYICSGSRAASVAGSGSIVIPWAPASSRLTSSILAWRRRLRPSI